MLAKWQNRSFLAPTLTAIHRHKVLCGSYGIQEDYDTPVGTKIEEDHFEKASLCPGGRLSHCGPDYRLGNSPIPLWTQIQHHLAFDLTLSVTFCQGT